MAKRWSGRRVDSVRSELDELEASKVANKLLADAIEGVGEGGGG